jgi:hypothetical protein
MSGPSSALPRSSIISGGPSTSLTDPESRAMAAHTNIQVAVDAKNNMIVEQAVTNQVVDMGLLTQSAEPARAILDAPVRSSSASSAPYRPRFSRSASIFSARFSSARLAEGGQGRRARGSSRRQLRGAISGPSRAS